MEVKDMLAFQPFNLAGIQLKNRLGSGPFGNHTAAPDGEPNEKTIRFYEPIARGGTGFIMMGRASCSPSLKGSEEKNAESGFAGLKGVGLASLDYDRFIPGWQRLNDVLHSYGAKTGVQLGPFGNQRMTAMSEPGESTKKYAYLTLGGKQALPGPYKIWTADELWQLIDDLGKGAARAKAGGFDCVELHCAHSSALLAAGALNPFFNERTDEFGGDPVKRTRFVVEAIKACRANVGPDFPILARLNADDMMGELGNTTEDIIRWIIPALEEAGLDVIDCSAGGPLYACQGPLPPVYYPRGFMMHYAAAIKKATKLPVIGVGRITTIEMAEKYLREGAADVIYLARQVFADPEIVNKYLAGQTRSEEVRQCIGCLVGCGCPCPVNFENEDASYANKEHIPITPAAKKKHVLIVGGGVGGMEAARIAAMRDHKVTLFERSGELGGTVSTLALTKMLAEFKNYPDYLIDQMRKLKVDVRVCCEATVENVKELAPDAVILATGADFVMPAQVAGEPMVMTHLDALKRRREFRSMDQWRKKVVIYGFTAAELAVDLAEEGADVTLMGPGGEASLCSEAYMGRERKFFLRRKLTDVNYIRRSPETYKMHNITVLYNVQLKGVSKDGVEIVYHGGQKPIPYDVLIISGAKKKNDALFEQLQGVVPEVYKIGDCAKIGDIHQATISANELALKI